MPLPVHRHRPRYRRHLRSAASPVPASLSCGPGGADPAEGDPASGTLTALVHPRRADPLALLLLSDWVAGETGTSGGAWGRGEERAAAGACWTRPPGIFGGLRFLTRLAGQETTHLTPEALVVHQREDLGGRRDPQPAPHLPSQPPTSRPVWVCPEFCETRAVAAVHVPHEESRRLSVAEDTGSCVPVVHTGGAPRLRTGVSWAQQPVTP